MRLFRPRHDLRLGAECLNFFERSRRLRGLLDVKLDWKSRVMSRRNFFGVIGSGIGGAAYTRFGEPHWLGLQRLESGRQIIAGFGCDVVTQPIAAAARSWQNAATGWRRRFVGAGVGCGQSFWRHGKAGSDDRAVP